MLTLNKNINLRSHKKKRCPEIRMRFFKEKNKIMFNVEHVLNKHAEETRIETAHPKHSKSLGVLDFILFMPYSLRILGNLEGDFGPTESVQTPKRYYNLWNLSRNWNSQKFSGISENINNSVFSALLKC